MAVDAPPSKPPQATVVSEAFRQNLTDVSFFVPNPTQKPTLDVANALLKDPRILNAVSEGITQANIGTGNCGALSITFSNATKNTSLMVQNAYKIATDGSIIPLPNSKSFIAEVPSATMPNASLRPDKFGPTTTIEIPNVDEWKVSFQTAGFKSGCPAGMK